jgi:hypothetical protein
MAEKNDIQKTIIYKQTQNLQMKTTKTTMAVAIMVMFTISSGFSGCKKDTTPPLVSGSFNGQITAQVENSAPSVGIVVPWNETDIVLSGGKYVLVGKQAGPAVIYSSNRFTLTLPNPPWDEVHLIPVKTAFEDPDYLGIKGNPKYSNTNALVADVDFLGWNTAGTSAYGFFQHLTSDGNTQCFYVYASEDVTVTGGSNLAVMLKAGWNRIYVSSEMITTKAPEEELKWYFSEFDF